MDTASYLMHAARPHLERMHQTDGWLSEYEAMSLFVLAHSIHETVPNPAIVEIGSFVGKSSIMLAAGLSGHGAVYCVDPFDKTNQSLYLEVRAARQMSSLLGRFKANTFPYTNIFPIEAYSHEAHYDGRIPVDLDMVFIDGNHNYPAVKTDVELWVPSLKPGGVLAMHDYGSLVDPDVARVIHEYGLGRQEHGWTKTITVDSLFISIRTEDPWTTPALSQ